MWPLLTRADKRLWVVPFFGLSLTIIAYLWSHPFPGGTAGLYLQASEAVVDHGFGLPRRIPGYTEGGVPLAYPPLAFYLAAILLWVGVDGLAIATYFPALVMLLSVYPSFKLGDEIKDERVGLLFASFLFFTPKFIEIKLLANGLTRGLATLLTLTGIYFAARMYRTQSGSDTLIAGICFGAVILTHPRWLFVAAVSYVALLFRSPTRRGLAHGAATAAIGAIVAAPWFLTVVSHHGIEPFVLASQTRGGILNLRYLLLLSPVGLTGTASVYLWTVTTLGGLYAFVTKQWYLIGWTGGGALIAGTFSGAFIPLALIAAIFVSEAVIPALETDSEFTDYPIGRIVVAGLLLPGLLWSPIWITNSVPGDKTPVVYHLSDEQQSAILWAESNTDPDATFIVADGPIDWLPYLADRTILISTFGTEWFGPTYQNRQLDLQVQLIRCSNLDCIQDVLKTAELRPDYVYASDRQVNRSTVSANPNWSVAFGNEEAVILRYRPESV